MALVRSITEAKPDSAASIAIGAGSAINQKGEAVECFSVNFVFAQAGEQFRPVSKFHMIPAKKFLVGLEACAHDFAMMVRGKQGEADGISYCQCDQCQENRAMDRAESTRLKAREIN